jgi:hypothetical protein
VHSLSFLVKNGDFQTSDESRTPLDGLHVSLVCVLWVFILPLSTILQLDYVSFYFIQIIFFLCQANYVQFSYSIRLPIKLSLNEKQIKYYETTYD